MLQLNSVHQGTFTLLKVLSSLDKFQEFYLAGGTALALQLGHRISVDLDLFTPGVFDSNEMFEYLKDSHDVSGAVIAANSLSLFLKMGEENIKVDLIRHNYPMLHPVQQVDNLRLCSLQDGAAMKLNAVANRGAKKDFYDIYTLLSHFSLQELLAFFQQKYEQVNSLTVLKSLVYFTDADIEPDPLSLINVSWADVKKELTVRVQAVC